jgi:hypothetical protein
VIEEHPHHARILRADIGRAAEKERESYSARAREGNGGPDGHRADFQMVLLNEVWMRMMNEDLRPNADTAAREEIVFMNWRKN